MPIRNSTATKQWRRAESARKPALGIWKKGACNLIHVHQMADSLSLQTQRYWWLIWRFGATLSNKIGHGTTLGRPCQALKCWYGPGCRVFYKCSSYNNFEINSMSKTHWKVFKLCFLVFCLRQWQWNNKYNGCTTQNLRVEMHQNPHFQLNPLGNQKDLEINPPPPVDHKNHALVLSLCDSALFLSLRWRSECWTIFRVQTSLASGALPNNTSPTSGTSSRAFVTALVTIQGTALKSGWVGDFESAPLTIRRALAPKWLRTCLCHM